MNKTEYKAKVATLSGLVDVLESLEDRAKGFLILTDDGEEKEPQYDDWGYEMWCGLTEASRIIEKELQKRMQ